MRFIRRFRISVGLLFVVGASPQIIRDFLKIEQGQSVNWAKFSIILLSILFMIGGLWLISLRGHKYARVKWLWERPAALLMLVCSSPFLVVAAIVVKLESPGKFLFCQQRIGRNRRERDRRQTDADAVFDSSLDRRKSDRRQRALGGRPFTIYKIRTMRTDSEEKTGPVWSTGECDPRITKWGYYLRRTHLDEVPQFLNVIKGDMSLIGPRPERPEFVEKLNNVIDSYENRLTVLPGITGLAQVRHSHDESLEDVKQKVVYDNEYVQKISLLLDIKVVLQTIAMMFGLYWTAFEARTIKRIQPKTVDAIVPERVRSSTVQDA